MKRFVLAGISLAGATLFGGSSAAMSSPARPAHHCQVVNPERLPAASGGAEALCAAIKSRISGQAPEAAVNIVVTVQSASMLAAELTVGGRALPEQKFARMDRDLDAGAFERFADTLAIQVQNAVQ
jgi:hypothetical protein